jgi:hypothetical protein
MAIEGHERGQGKDHQQKGKYEMDKELAEIRMRMEKLAFQMQESTKVHWVYEWPIRRKAKWPVKESLARGQ